MPPKNAKAKKTRKTAASAAAVPQRTSRRLAGKAPDLEETGAAPSRTHSSSTEDSGGTEYRPEDEEAARILSDLREEKSQTSKKSHTSRKSSASRKSTGSKKEAPSVGSPKPRKLDPFRSNKLSLDPEVQKELLRNCESLELDVGGGRDAVANRKEGIPNLLIHLHKIGKTEVVGEPGTKHRKACDSKLRNWFKLRLEEYEDLCLNAGVVPARVAIQSVLQGEKIPTIGSGASEQKSTTKKSAASNSNKTKKTAASSTSKPPGNISSPDFGQYRDKEDEDDLSQLTEEDSAPAPSKGTTMSTPGPNNDGYQLIGNTWIRECFVLLGASCCFDKAIFNPLLFNAQSTSQWMFIALSSVPILSKSRKLKTCLFL
jgi:hypothetical protein